MRNGDAQAIFHHYINEGHYKHMAKDRMLEIIEQLKFEKLSPTQQDKLTTIRTQIKKGIIPIKEIAE